MANAEWSGKTVLVVINPLMRGKPEKVIAALRRYAPPDIELDIRWTAPNRPVRDLIADRLPEAAAVIACGGDGTVSDVVTAIDGYDLPVGIIPRGTTNIVARETEIPLDVESAAKIIFGEHSIARLDVGLCLGHRFLHMGGAGLDSRLFCAVHPKLKQLLGWPAYILAGVECLFAPPSEFTITTDETTVQLRSRLVLVANGAAILRASLPIYPGLRRDDGVLDVIAFTATTPPATVRTLGRFAVRRLAGSGDVIHLKARRVELRSEPPLPVEVDGDVVGEAPATFTIDPGALRLIVPQTRSNRGS